MYMWAKPHQTYIYIYICTYTRAAAPATLETLSASTKTRGGRCENYSHTNSGHLARAAAHVMRLNPPAVQFGKRVQLALHVARHLGWHSALRITPTAPVVAPYAVRTARYARGGYAHGVRTAAARPGQAARPSGE